MLSCSFVSCRILECTDLFGCNGNGTFSDPYVNVSIQGPLSRYSTDQNNLPFSCVTVASVLWSFHSHAMVWCFFASHQHSKLTFSKSRPSIIKWSPYKNFRRPNCNIQGRTLCVRHMNFYYAKRHVCSPFLWQIVTFTRLPFKTL